MSSAGMIHGNLGHASNAYIVDTADAAAILNEYIERERRLESHNGDEPHALQDLAERLSPKYGQTPAACVRRLYAIRSCESKATNLTLFECLLDAIDSHLSFVDVPVFPGGKQAAREMAEVWSDNEVEARRLAQSLLSFTRGYIAGEPFLNGDFGEVAA